VGSRVLEWPIVLTRKLARVVPDAAQRFLADHCPQQAAGIAYRVLFSIAPLAIVLVSIFGLVLQDDGVRHAVVTAIVDALPVSAAGKKDVENAITAIATPASAAGLVSLLVFAWAATGMMAALRQGLEQAMHVTESRPAARAKLVDLILIVGAALLVLVTVGITLLGNLVQRASGSLGEAIGLGAGTLASGLLRAAMFGLSIVVVLLLYRFVPARGFRIRDGLAGAIVTALLLQLISLASGWIYEKTTRLSVVYGSLTAALVFLYSMYLYSSALLLGAEVAAAWSRPHTADGRPILTQLRRAVLGLFVTQNATPADRSVRDATTDDETLGPLGAARDPRGEVTEAGGGVEGEIDPGSDQDHTSDRSLDRE
jgi:membrane protein